MATVTTIPSHWSAADLIVHLGGIPASRILMVPAPGTASLEDVVSRMRSGEDRVCELVDGVLVEKPMGSYESLVAALLIRLLGDWAEARQAGIVLGEAGALRILPDQVRVPDVSFIAWERFPGRRLPQEPVPAVVPDLAVEILSEGNTAEEMRRKVSDYLSAGVRLVWLIDPRRRTAVVHEPAAAGRTIAAEGELDGGMVLPGFRVPLAEVFRRAEGRP